MWSSIAYQPSSTLRITSFGPLHPDLPSEIPLHSLQQLCGTGSIHRSRVSLTGERTQAVWALTVRAMIGARDPLAGADFRIGLTFMETGQWMAVDDQVGYHGEGDTCAEAVHDLVISLFDNRDVLREHQTELAPRLERELVILDDTLRDEML